MFRQLKTWFTRQRVISRSLKALRSDNIMDQERAVKALGELRAVRALAPLLLLRTIDHGDWYRRAVQSAIGSILRENRGVRRLCRLLSSGSDELRGEAAQQFYLRSVDDPIVFSNLRGALGDRNERVRRYAARAIGASRHPDAFSTVCALLSSEDVSLKEAAAEAIGSLGDARGVAVLAAALLDPEPKVRTAAAESLGKLRSDQAIEPLLRALRDESNLVRVAASNSFDKLLEAIDSDVLAGLIESHPPPASLPFALALGKRGDPRAAEPVLALHAFGAMQRDFAAKTLVQLDDMRAVTVLLSPPPSGSGVGELLLLLPLLERKIQAVPEQELRLLASVPDYTWVTEHSALYNDMEPGSRTETVRWEETHVTSVGPIRSAALAELARRGLAP